MNALKIPAKRISEIIEFLLRTGLAQYSAQQKLEIGETEIRLGNQSHLILKHHANWRVQAIESLEREDVSDLHYSGVVSVSKNDIFKIKDRILELLKENLKTIKASQEEELYTLCIDFFNLKR